MNEFGLKYSFRGHIEDCLKAYVEAFSKMYPPGERNTGKAKIPIMEFCDAERPTLDDWFAGRSIPRADKLIRLICWLDASGFQVIEFTSLDRSLRNFAELVGYGLFTVDDLGVKIGYGQTKHLSLAFQGKETLSDERRSMLWEIWKQNREALTKRKAEVRKQLICFQETSTETPVVKQPLPTHPRSNGQATGLLLMIEGMLTMLGEEPLGNIPSSDFAHVSDTKIEKVSLLSMRLGELAVEITKARKETRDDSQQSK